MMNDLMTNALVELLKALTELVRAATKAVEKND